MARMWFVLAVWMICAFGTAAQTPQRPSTDLEIAGEWQLNGTLSDDVPLLPGEAVARARASGVLPTAARPARATRGPDPVRRTGIRRLLRAEFTAEQLRIDKTGGTLTLAFGENHTLSVVPDGRKGVLEQGGFRVAVVSTWSPPLFTVDREYEDGTRVTETWAAFEKPRQLVATSTIENDRAHMDPVTFTRVFELVAR